MRFKVNLIKTGLPYLSHTITQFDFGLDFNNINQNKQYNLIKIGDGLKSANRHPAANTG